VELELHARQTELAELLEHMTEEEALEALGAEMLLGPVLISTKRNATGIKP
jgi:hypothetical protein